MLIYNDSKIEGIFNSYLINFRFDTKYSKYELELKDIKKVLQDLSILLCYDLEPCHDIICAKFSNIRGISYPFFKECLYNFLDKKEVRLNTMFLAEQNSVPLEDVKTIGNNNIFNKRRYEESENIEEIKITDDLNLIILHRSLYILKKKFEKYKPQFKEIYNKYSEKIFDFEGNKGEILENEILVEKNQVPKILVELMNKGKFELDALKNIKDAINKEMKYYNNNINIEDNIMKEFIEYVNKNRRKYNYIYKEKKINRNFKLESYLDYIPTGDDELTKIVIETVGENNKNIKNDNISEIVPNKIQLNEMNKDDLISEISRNKNVVNEENENSNEDKKDFNGEILLEEKNKNNQNENIVQNEENNNNNNNVLINKNKVKKNSFYSEVENKKTIKYSKYFLYIESLPLIIADFISNQNKPYIILDHGDDLRNDLRTLFDNEILGRLGEEITYEINRNKIEQLKELLLNKAKIEKNISCYEDLLYQMRTRNQNVSFVLITIQKLKNSLDWIEKKISVIQDDTNTFNEYENNLRMQKLNKKIIQQKNNNINKKEKTQKNPKKHNIKNIRKVTNEINETNEDKEEEDNNNEIKDDNNEDNENDENKNDNENDENKNDNENEENKNDNENEENKDDNENEENKDDNENEENKDDNENEENKDDNENDGKSDNSNDNNSKSEESENKDNISKYSKSKNSKNNESINNISFKKNSQNEENSNNGEIIENIESKKQSQLNSRRLSEISILKLDKHIEGIDTARLIDSNLINKDNLFFSAKKSKNVENQNNRNNLNFFNQYSTKKVQLPKIKPKGELSKEEKREINIKEIFNFYSHQHSNAGHKTTFDSIRDKFEHLNLSEFAKFCTEFKVMIPKEKIIEIFKKTATSVKEMSFQEFKVALSKISTAINEEKIKQLKKRITHFKNSLNYNNRNMTIENLKKEQVDELVKKCKEEIKQLNKKTNEELLEEFYLYLQIDEEEKYHLKMKGFVLPIFQGGSSVLHTVIGEQATTKNLPVKVKLGNIKEMIEKRKEQKKNIEKNVIRVNGLDREHQKKRLDQINTNKNIFLNNSLLNIHKKNKLEPIKQTNSNYSDTNINNRNRKKYINDILNLKNNENEFVFDNNLSDNIKIAERYEINNWNNNNIRNYNKENMKLNSFPRKLKDLINDEEAEKEVSEQLNFKPNNILGNNTYMNPLFLKNKNVQNVKENKYTWESLEKMKSSSLVDENELNNLIK